MGTQKKLGTQTVMTGNIIKCYRLHESKCGKQREATNADVSKTTKLY